MDVYSTLVGKISDAPGISDMLALMSIDGRRFVRNAMQVVSVPVATAKLAKKLADQQGWHA